MKKPPYLLLCDHNALPDGKVAAKAIFPRFANDVAAIDGFIGRERLLRRVGCICRGRFKNDVTLVRRRKRVTEHGVPFATEKRVPSRCSCHAAYDYPGRFGDCADLNTLEDTRYLYPHDCDFFRYGDGACDRRAVLCRPPQKGDRDPAGSCVKPVRTAVPRCPNGRGRRFAVRSAAR
jgi:hypothetical protein